MKLIGTILLIVWLILVGLAWGSWVDVNIKLLAGLAIITGVVIALEVANVIEK